MSNPGRRPRGINIFENNFQGTSEEAANQIFSTESLGISEQRQVAKPVSIFDIRPDLSQPRRAIPWALRPQWDGRPQTLEYLFEMWVEAIEAEKGQPYNLTAHLEQAYLPLEQEDEQADAPEMSPAERSLHEIIALAASIRSVGLTNPITVVRIGPYFQLETGERRWLAYHLLNLYDNAEEWAKIPAREVKQFNVWRQAGENNARANLNAISKARQLAILLMDLLHERGQDFETFEQITASGRKEREYYAQVADGTEFRIPPGQKERLLDALGFKSMSQVRHYRALLRVPDAVWEYADDHDLSERQIRELDWSSVPQGTLLKKTQSVPRGTLSKAGELANPFVEPVNKKRHSKIWSYANQLDTLNKKQLADALVDIQAEKRWLEELERALRNRTEAT